MLLLLPLLLIFHLVFLSQLTFTAWPEMFSYPYLNIQGFTLYKDFIMPYPPGLILLLVAVFNLFGIDPVVLKNLTWALILIVDISLFYLLRQATRSFKLSSLFLFIFIVLQSLLDGNMLWFDFASELPVFLGFVFSTIWLERRKIQFLAITSAFFALGVVVKQTALIYLGALALSYLLVNRKIIWKEIGVIVLGVGMVFTILLVYIWQISALKEFWQWTLLYPLTQWSKFPGYVQMALNFKQVIFLIILIFPVSGVFFHFPKILKEKKIQVLLIFIVSALIAIYPRFSYFHLQPVLPFLILLVAEIYLLLKPKKKIVYLSLVFMTLAVISFFVGPDVWGQKIRFYDTEDQQQIEQVKAVVSGEKRVFLQGLYSSIYVFSGTLPSKNWSDNFGWYLEIPGVQEWVLQGFETDPPQIVIWRQPKAGRWFGLGTYQPQKITEYIELNYHKTGNIESGVQVWQRN